MADVIILIGGAYIIGVTVIGLIAMGRDPSPEGRKRATDWFNRAMNPFGKF